MEDIGGDCIQGLFLDLGHQSYGFGVLKTIREGLESFSRFTKYTVGNGKFVRFCHGAK